MRRVVEDAYITHGKSSSIDRSDSPTTTHHHTHRFHSTKTHEYTAIMKVAAILATAILAVAPTLATQPEHNQQLQAREAVLDAREAYIDALHDLHQMETREYHELDARDDYKNCLQNCMNRYP